MVGRRGGRTQSWAIRGKECVHMLVCRRGGGGGHSVSWTFLIHYRRASLQVALCRHAEWRVCRDVTGWVCAWRVSACMCVVELSADASDVR